MRARAVMLVAATLAWFSLTSVADAERRGPLNADDYQAYGGLFGGTYTVIGRLPKTGVAYTGWLTLVAQGREFKVVRHIAGETAWGRAFVDVDPVGRHILVMEFTQGSHPYECTYLFMMNFDSWFRFTGHVAEPGHSKDSEDDDGLEALFPPDDPACGIDA